MTTDPDYLIANIANVARKTVVDVMREKRHEKLLREGHDNLQQSVSTQDNLAHATAHCIAALLIRDHASAHDLGPEAAALIEEHLRRDVDRNAKHEDHVAHALTRLAMADALVKAPTWFEWAEVPEED